GYDYAFTTKVYGSLVSGCPVIFAGVGPTGPFLRAESAEQPVGVAVDWSAAPVREAMLSAAESPLRERGRAALAEWAAGRYSLRSVAERIVAESETVVRSRRDG
ncbi:MAG: glycosyltransferase, partial [Microbacterium sp.]